MSLQEVPDERAISPIERPVFTILPGRIPWQGEGYGWELGVGVPKVSHNIALRLNYRCRYGCRLTHDGATPTRQWYVDDVRIRSN